MQDAMNAEAAGWLDVAAALADGDPLKTAQVAFDKAQQQMAAARSGAERLSALAAEINAQHQLRDALNAIADAQGQVVLAMLNAAGDTVGAAREVLRQDRANLSRYLQQHPGANAGNDPKVSEQNTKIINDVAAARNAALQDQEDNIQFLLDTNKISTGQAIARLQNLLSTANLTKQQKQQIEREIYNLKQEITKDLQFNLPSDLKLPTLYEARRFTESQSAGAGYQDNRTYTITISSTKIDATEAVNKVQDVINQPSRFGVRSRTY
jgi:hypothetical protein